MFFKPIHVWVAFFLTKTKIFFSLRYIPPCFIRYFSHEIPNLQVFLSVPDIAHLTFTQMISAHLSGKSPPCKVNRSCLFSNRLIFCESECSVTVLRDPAVSPVGDEHLAPGEGRNLEAEPAGQHPTPILGLYQHAAFKEMRRNSQTRDHRISYFVFRMKNQGDHLLNKFLLNISLVSGTFQIHCQRLRSLFCTQH